MIMMLRLAVLYDLCFIINILPPLICHIFFSISNCVLDNIENLLLYMNFEISCFVFFHSVNGSIFFPNVKIHLKNRLSPQLKLKFISSQSIDCYISIEYLLT